MAYRYANGIGVEKSCARAVEFYQDLARKVTLEFQLNNRRHTYNPSFRYLDPELAESDMQQSVSHAIDHVTSQEDVITYYEFSAQRGDTSAQVSFDSSFFVNGLS